MRELVLEFQSSGLTRKIFCEQRSVSIHTLAYWLGKIKRENMSSGFIAVSSGMVHSTSGFELEYPNGVKLRVGTGENIQVLRQLIEIY